MGEYIIVTTAGRYGGLDLRIMLSQISRWYPSPEGWTHIEVGDFSPTTITATAHADEVDRAILAARAKGASDVRRG